MKYEFLAVDIQNEFATAGGKHYKNRPSVNFNKEILFPILKERNIKISEIISDYRHPRPGNRQECCVPGTWGYQSIIPEEMVKSRWVKCMNSPVWIRDNIGDPNKIASLPYQDTKAFDGWIDHSIGDLKQVVPVIFGLTVDCCILSTVQELSWRGCRPLVLKEGVDHYNATDESKEAVLNNCIQNWGDVITWEEFKCKI